MEETMWPRQVLSSEGPPWQLGLTHDNKQWFRAHVSAIPPEGRGSRPPVIFIHPLSLVESCSTGVVVISWPLLLAMHMWAPGPPNGKGNRDMEGPRQLRNRRHLEGWAWGWRGNPWN